MLLLLLARHHFPDRVLHDLHRAQQHPGFVAAARWKGRRQLPSGNALGDHHCRGQRPDDAPGEKQRGRQREEEGQPGRRDGERARCGDGIDRALPLDEAAPGGVFDQQIKLVHDLFVERIEFGGHR